MRKNATHYPLDLAKRDINTALYGIYQSAIIIANAIIMYILLANVTVGRSAPISSTIRSTQINSVVNFFIIITPSPVRFVESL